MKLIKSIILLPCSGNEVARLRRNALQQKLETLRHYPANFVKLKRVALLPLVALATSLAFREGKGGVMPPWFLTMFVIFVLVNNLMPLPDIVADGARVLSGWLLLTAIAALGIRTSLGEMAEVGPQAATVVIGRTIALLFAALGAERLLF